MRPFHNIGRVTKSPNQKNIQALSAVALHRSCGFAKVLDVMKLCKQNCSTGVTVRRKHSIMHPVHGYTVRVLRLRGPDIGECMHENGRRQARGRGRHSSMNSRYKVLSQMMS